MAGQFYADEIRRAPPGVTQVTIHLARDDAEMRAITAGHPDWGAAWRQRDFDYFTSDELRRLLAENHITLVTYRQLGRLLPAAAPVSALDGLRRGRQAGRKCWEAGIRTPIQRSRAASPTVRRPPSRPGQERMF